MRIDASHSDRATLAELGRRLAHTRLERNLTQEELAREAGISKATVERLEAGEAVKSTSLIHVLRALGLLEALDRLIPEPLPSPLERVKMKGRRRQRARMRGPDEPSSPWRWGDEGGTS